MALKRKLTTSLEELSLPHTPSVILTCDSDHLNVSTPHPSNEDAFPAVSPGQPEVPGKRIWGLLAMLASSFMFAIMALLVKCLNQFHTFELVFWRSLFMFIGTMAVLLAKGVNPLGPPGACLILSVRGVAGFGFMSAYYFAIKRMALSDAVVITYTSPVITGVAAALLLGEAWGALDAAGSFLCLSGVVLISKPSFIMSLLGVTTTPPPLDGMLGALGAAFLSASVYLLLRYAKHLSPMVSVNYFALVGLILSPIFSLWQGESWTLPSGFALVGLMMLAVLSIVGQAMMNVGLALETAGRATAMNYVQVVFANLFQTFIFHTSTDTLSVIGATLIASWGAIALIKETGASKGKVAAHESQAHCGEKPSGATQALTQPMLPK